MFHMSMIKPIEDNPIVSKFTFTSNPSRNLKRIWPQDLLIENVNAVIHFNKIYYKNKRIDFLLSFFLYGATVIEIFTVNKSWLIWIDFSFYTNHSPVFLGMRKKKLINRTKNGFNVQHKNSYPEFS